MASEDTLAVITPLSNEPGTAAFATLDTRNSHTVLDFDDTTAENAIFKGIMPNNYAGGGVTVIPHVATTSGTAGTVVMCAAFESVGTALDIDADSFAGTLNGTIVVPATTGLLGTIGIGFSDGAAMDSLAVGQSFRLKVGRLPADAEDSLVGDAELYAVEIKET